MYNRKTFLLVWLLLLFPSLCLAWQGKVGDARHCEEPSCAQWLQIQPDAGKNAGGPWSMSDALSSRAAMQDPGAAQADSQSTLLAKKKDKGPPPFHGNTVTHVFHAPGCQEYDCDTCIVPFKTREQALRAGYKPCSLCNP